MNPKQKKQRLRLARLEFSGLPAFVGVFWMLLVSPHPTLATAAEADDDRLSCQSVIERFQPLRTNDDQVIYDTKRNDSTLEICVSPDVGSGTCCSRRAEEHLHRLTVNHTAAYVASLGAPLLAILTANTDMYRNDFLQLMTSAENATIRTLTDDFRIRNDGVDCCGFVTRLFRDMVAVFNSSSGGAAGDVARTDAHHPQVDIRKSVAQFFDDLFSFVFRYFVTDSPASAERRRDAAFAACIASSRRSLRVDPIGDGDDVLADSLSRSLGSSRTLVEALRTAAATLRGTADRLMPELVGQCSAALTRLQLCALCDGHPDETTVRPCLHFCLDVARGCFGRLADELGPRWDLFVDGVSQLVAGMRGPYDVEDVLNSLPTRMAEGIMNTMLNVPTYYWQVMSKCQNSGGTDVVPLLPTKSPTAEHLPAAAVSRLVPPARHRQRSRSRLREETHQRRRDGQMTVKLRQKIQMLVRQIVSSAGLFSRLPVTFCSSERLAAGNYDVCWNGSALGPYNKSHTAAGSSSTSSSPPVPVSGAENSELRTLLGPLDDMTKLLHSQRLPKQHSSMQADESPPSVVVDKDEAAVATDDDTEPDDTETDGSGSGGESGGRYSGDDEDDNDDDDDYSGDTSGDDYSDYDDAEKAHNNTTTTTSRPTDFTFDDATSSPAPVTSSSVTPRRTHSSTAGGARVREQPTVAVDANTRQPSVSAATTHPPYSLIPLVCCAVLASISMHIAEF